VLAAASRVAERSILKTPMRVLMRCLRLLAEPVLEQAELPQVGSVVAAARALVRR
jgi:hypothetical protein